MRALVRFACAVAIAAPLTCQSDNPYFSLSSNRTFGTNEEASVNLTGVDVSAVQIRVYHVKDPVRFYSDLEDAHTFGGTNPRPRGKRTWLEIIHDWKRAFRRDIRYDLRSQFTESPSAHFSKPEEEVQPKQPTRETYFAQAPVLNQEQLVLSFIQPVAGTDRWNSIPVPIHVKDKGVYLVEAVTGNLRAYTILTVSDMVMITKVGKTEMLTYLANRQTGDPIPGADVSQIAKHSDPVNQQTDANGITDTKLPDTHGAGVRIIAVKDKDVAFNDLNTYFMAGSNAAWTGYIYTDRPVYRPGDTVHFRGILRRQASVGYQTPSSQSVTAEVTDPDGKAIYQKTLTTNSHGIINDEFTVEKTSSLGSFYIQVHADESNMTGSFEVQEYKKPEYEVRVTPEKPRVLEGETVKAVIDSKYYFGEPVAGAKVGYSVHRSRYWFPYWADPGEDDVEAGNNDDNSDTGDELEKQEGTLDADGKLTISVPTEVSDKHLDYTYRIEVGVTDKAGREISGTGWITATYGNFNVSVEPTSYVITPGSTTSVKVTARDYDNKPIAAHVHLVLGTWDWNSQKMDGRQTQMDVTTGDDGLATANVTVPDSGGEIRVLASADSAGRTVEGYTYIWAPKENFDWGFSNQRSLKIVSDQKTYKKGDKAKILIIAGKDGAAVLVTVEGGDLRSHHLLRAKRATAEFEYDVTADDEPGFFVSAEYIQGGALYQGQKRISVPPVDHTLDLKISTDKPTYLPGQSATYDIQATGPDGKPAANADLSLGVVD
jgi:hypothetical protein